ncbi:MAG: ABC transporter permease [Ruminococcus sp.]|nr:ABC transporter permease [Ruminococcus sp.]
MKNPLNKRLPRELKSELPKYLIIFLFFVMTISAVSGFLISDNSLRTATEDAFSKFSIEHGNYEFTERSSDEDIKAIEQECGIRIYENFYKEELVQSLEDTTFRVFGERTEINLVDVWEGSLPSADDELGIDRLFAKNHDLGIGDTIRFADKEFRISGIVALTDYSCLYQNPSDMMFDNDKFGVGVLTKSGFDKVRDDHIHYSYSWLYNNEPADDAAAKTAAEELVAKLSAHGSIERFIPAFSNNAIQFALNDMKGDSMGIVIFLYVIIIILAFVFSITISNTITKEAGTIGTLRASGYTRGEMIRHYMILPMLTLTAGAVVGNLLGYTLLNDIFAAAYLNSYSLTTYETLFTPEAFVKTTLIPFVLMFFINLIMLVSKLKLSPLRFLRRDLKKRSRKKAFRLNTKIPIMIRFRLRVIFQNLPNYIMIFFGVLFAEFMIMFSLIFGPMLDTFQENTTDHLLAKCQYILKAPVPTGTEGAEAYTASSLRTIEDETGIVEEDVTIYGLDRGSSYIALSSEKGKVDISTAYHKKYGVDIGDKIKLKDQYSGKVYELEVGGYYEYPAIIAVFMDREELNGILGYEDGYFNAYFSDNTIEDIEEKYIATRITETELTKTSRQLMRSMGSMMIVFTLFGTVIYVLVIYLLAKIIVEKNTQSISMTKILGYNDGEINSLYIHSTTIVTVISLLVSLLICDRTLAVVMFQVFKSYSGWFEYVMTPGVAFKVLGLGLGTYLLVVFILSRKVKKIPLDEALKNVE